MRLGIFHPKFEDIRGAECLVTAQIQEYKNASKNPELITYAFNAENWKHALSSTQVHLLKGKDWVDYIYFYNHYKKMQHRTSRANKTLQEFDIIIAHNSPTHAILGNSQIRAKKIWQCNEPPRSIHLNLANPTLANKVQASPNDENFATQWFRGKLAHFDHQPHRFSPSHGKLLFDIEGVNNIDLTYAISQFSRNNVRNIYNISCDDIVYPIVQFPEDGWKKSGLCRDVRRILIHSRLEPLKNIDTAIRGFSIFAKHSPVPCELHIVGEGSAKSQLQKLADSLPSCGKIIFHGFLHEKELQSVYEICDVFTLLPLDEPFGLVFPEAASKGLLLVGPNHGGPLEILDDGELGWTIDAFSPGALAEALEQIWHLNDFDIDKRRLIVDLACRNRYSRDTIGPQLIRLLSKV